MFRLTTVFWVALFAISPALADPDWRSIGDETADLLGDLIRIDTTNPPGGETAAANAVARKLAADGIAAEVLESSPGRGNLYARLAGTGRGRPVVLLSHLDVVPADPRGWRVPPFLGLRKDGQVHGRGALDAKGLTAIELMAVIALKRSGQPLDRDIILLATADEETGGKAGAGWLAKHRPDLVRDAEFLLNEGDGIHVRPSGRKIAQVAVAEKTPCWVRLTAQGDPGHGSTPPPQTSVTRLVRALDKIRRYQAPIKVIPSVESYFAALAPFEAEPLRSKLLHLSTALMDPGFLTDFERNPRQNALIRNTLTPTVLQGSPKINVIPAEASAELDCRLLPGERPSDFVASLSELVGDETVQVETILSFPASSSPENSQFVDAVRQLATRELGGIPVVPSVIPGFTDSHYFRELGIASYGFTPFVLGDEDGKTVHGPNEHVSIDNLRNGVKRLVALLRLL